MNKMVLIPIEKYERLMSKLEGESPNNRKDHRKKSIDSSSPSGQVEHRNLPLKSVKAQRPPGILETPKNHTRKKWISL
jgi:hypothetical protein